MKGKSLKQSRLLAPLTLALVAGVPGLAAAQQAKLYEIVENLDVVEFQQSGGTHRVSNWSAQGSADVGSPFCPPAVVPPGVTSCTITAFGRDEINLTTFSGTVWANVVAVANLDNVVDGPEGGVFSGQITGNISFLPPAGGGPVQPDLGKKKSLLGPSVPLIYVTDGKFFADTFPVIRECLPSMLPTGKPTAKFGSTFRLPFIVDNNGKHETPQHGKNAFYLADDGSLIKVDRQEEFALDFPLLRAEVFFKK
jgi:hypothetical protein